MTSHQTNGPEAGSGHGPLRPPRNLSAMLFSIPKELKYLDADELERLTRAFRHWKEAVRKTDARHARERIWLVFLLLRHTGARIGEVLALSTQDFDLEQGVVTVGHNARDAQGRDIPLHEDLLRETRRLLPELEILKGAACFELDQGYLRRVFYARAQEAGLDKERGAPSVLRTSRAVEMLRNGTPMSVVQRTLGLETPPAGLKEYSTDALGLLQRYYAHAERRARSSARNAFTGAVQEVHRGEVMSEVQLQTPSGLWVAACITTTSLENLDIRKNTLLTASIKAPLINLAAAGTLPATSACNRFEGRITDIRSDTAVSEVTVTLECGQQVCALISTSSLEELGLQAGDMAVAFFKALSVVLQLD